MQELIKVNCGTEQPTVSARELYDLLSSEGGLSGTERFSKWFDRYIGYGFRENIDYSTPYKKVRVQMEGKENGRSYSREIWCKDTRSANKNPKRRGNAEYAVFRLYGL